MHTKLDFMPKQMSLPFIGKTEILHDSLLGYYEANGVGGIQSQPGLSLNWTNKRTSVMLDMY